MYLHESFGSDYVEMPNIKYTASDFSRHWGPGLSGSHTITVSWNELIWAALTIGKPGVAYLLSHGWHSVSDLIVRSHTVYAYLREDYTYIKKSSLFAALDPTEKSGVSYFMGMLAAKILSSRLLSTPWLFHVSMSRALGAAVATKGKSQPDLIGLNHKREWIVVEAKGRSWSYSDQAMIAAKEQTRQLHTINGQHPALRVAVQASFNPRLEWAMEDPEEIDEDAVDMELNTEHVMAMYYSGATSATDDGPVREIGDRMFRVRELREIGVTIAMDLEVRNRLSTVSMSDSEERAARGLETETYGEGHFVVFPDGIGVAVDDRWSEDRMARDPILRRGS